MAMVNINLVTPWKDTTVGSLEPGSYFTVDGVLFLKLHMTRNSPANTENQLSVVIPNFDHTPEDKVSGAYVCLADGTGRYLKDSTPCHIVTDVSIEAKLGY